MVTSPAVGVFTDTLRTVVPITDDRADTTTVGTTLNAAEYATDRAVFVLATGVIVGEPALICQ
jgi:hypothetical protein